MSDYMIWNELGNVYLKIGEIEDAIAAYLKAIELNPRFGWPYSNLAFAQVQKGNYAEAIDLYRKSLELLKNHRDRAISWNRLGDAYRQAQDYQHALEAYQTADQVGSEVTPEADEMDLAVLFPEAILAQDTANPPADDPLQTTPPPPDLSSTQQIPPRLAFEPPFPDAPAGEEGQGLEPVEPVEGQSRELREWLRELLEEDAQRESRALDSGLWVARRNAPAAKPAAQPPQRETPGDRTYEPTASAPRPVAPTPAPYPAAGNPFPAVMELEPPIQADLFEAEPAFEPVLEAVAADVYDPSPDQEQTIASHRRPAWANRPATIPIPPPPPQTGPLDPLTAEIRKCEKVLSMNPVSDRSWDSLGKCYKSQGRYEEAIAAFGKAIKVAPDHDAYHYNLGLVFTIQNRYLEAIECFQRVLTLNPEYNLAHGALAGCYRRLGREEEAVRHIAIATPLMEDESEYNRACFNAICGNVDQAISLLRVALQSQGVTLEWVQSDPDLEPIRQDPRYQELLDEYPPAAGAV